MQPSFQLVKQFADVVVIESGLAAQGTSVHDEWSGCAVYPAEVQTGTKEFIDQLFERPPRLARLGLQLGKDVLIEGECGPHILMLGQKHQDVKWERSQKLGGRSQNKKNVRCQLSVVHSP